jgi:ribosome-associated protein
MAASDTASHRAVLAATAASDKLATDLVALDVSDQIALTDVFLICSGRNERMVQAIADEVEERLLEDGAKRLRQEGRADGRWILLDFGDIVVHVFHEEERLFYQLERLWRDCPLIPLPAELLNGGDANTQEGL